MDASVKILLLREPAEPADPLLAELQRSGLQLTAKIAHGKADLMAALSQGDWDAVLCDTRHKETDSLGIWKVLQQQTNPPPLIVLTKHPSLSNGCSKAKGYYACGNIEEFTPLLVEALARTHAQRTHPRSESDAAGPSRLQRAVDACGLGFWDWDLRDQTLYFSPRWKRQVGCQEGEIGNRFDEWEERLHPQDRPLFLRALRRYLELPLETYESEYRLRHTDGHYRWFLCRGMVLQDANGAPERMMGLQLDVSRRRQQELTQATRERQQAVLAELSRQGLSTLDLQTFMDRATDLVCQTLGAEFAGILERTDSGKFLDLRSGHGKSPGAPRQGVRMPADPASHAGYTLLVKQPVIVEDFYRESRFTAESWLREQGILSGACVVIPGRQGEFGVLGVHSTKCRSYTPYEVLFLQSIAAILSGAIERHQAENASRTHECQFRSLIHQSADVVAIVDADGVFRFISPSSQTVLGWPPEELLDKKAFDWVHPQDAPATREAFDRLLAREQLPATLEIRFRCRDRGWRYLEVVGNNLLEDLNVRGIVINARDISDRKAAEAALKSSEERYRHFFEDDLTGDYICSPDGRILECNQAFADMFGFASIEEVLRCSMNDLYGSPEEGAALLELLRQERKLIHHQGEMRRRDGKAVFVIRNIIGTFNEHGEIAQIKGYIFDATGYKHLEDQFRQAQKMEAIGRLAGGVAHDFNNILLAILGYSNLLLEHLPPHDPHREEADQIKRAAERAAALTRQLLAFSRKQVLQPKLLNLNSLVQDLSNLLKRLIGENIELITEMGNNLGQIKADPGQLEQVIVNLAVNARDAMPNGGRLVIQTANVDLDAAFTEAHPGVRPGPYVLLAISDSGYGMPPEVQAHLFEPFFTTKEKGKGTGLGLSTVYGIVKQSGGDVQVETTPGKGTSFRIYLPRLEEPADVTPKTKAVDTQKISGSLETILLVEDEEAVRSLILRLLQMNGYSVLDASNGVEAMYLAERIPSAIDLLVTDLVMPQMGGHELAERLGGSRPGLRVLYISGYTDDAVVRYGLLKNKEAFLQKPFTPQELLQKVRDLLDRPTCKTP